jgi:hypothetical protein
MVSTCANPDCTVPFRRLREGRLIVIDRFRNADLHGDRSTSGCVANAHVGSPW